MAEIAKIDLTPKSKQLLRRLIKLDKKKFFKNLEAFFSQQALLTAGHISKELLSGQLLRRRTGALARSMTGRGVRVGGIPAMRVGVFRGPALAYAAIQEHGGTIVAKDKLLAIPTEGGPAETSAGVERFGGPRKFPDKLVFVPFRKGGNVVGGLYTEAELAKSKGAGSSLRDSISAYLLMRKVTIKPKHYLRDGVRSQLPLIAEDLAKFLGIQFSNLSDAAKKKKAKSVSKRSLRSGRRRDVRGRFI